MRDPNVLKNFRRIHVAIDVRPIWRELVDISDLSARSADKMIVNSEEQRRTIVNYSVSACAAVYRRNNGGTEPTALAPNVPLLSSLADRVASDLKGSVREIALLWWNAANTSTVVETPFSCFGRRFDFIIRCPAGIQATFDTETVVLQQGEIWRFDHSGPCRLELLSIGPHVHAIFDVVPGRFGAE